MRIVDEKMNQTVCFSDLAPGTVFCFGGWYGMCLNGATGQEDNAVDLKTGELVYMKEWEQVVPLHDAYLVV